MPGRERIYAIARDITQQILLESEIVAIADREKERMGRELHDGLCQNLAGIAALSAALSRRLAAHADPSATAAAAEIANLLNDAISQARDLARGLVPLGLIEAGLEGAIETLACNVKHLFHVSCTLTCDHPGTPLPPEVAVHLFRITQEAVHNAVAHGRANQIEITLSCKDGQGLLSVWDTGVGLCVKASQGKGIGLHTMAYRVRMIGGTLEVLTPPWGGTRVVCVFPLPASPDASEVPDHARHPA
ncbi:MAG: sensor histidine kinase [Chromatiaceae bacterium]